MTRSRAIGLGLLLVFCRAGAHDDASDASESAAESSTGPGPEGWTVVHAAGPAQGAIMSVWVRAPDQVLAVGGQPPAPGESSVGVALAGDAGGLDAVELPAGTAMLNWVFQVDELTIAVGQEGSIVRTEGGSWTSDESGTDRTLWGVWGPSAAELWVVGGNGSSDDPVLLHGVDGAWSPVDLPPHAGVSHGLFKVWGTAADAVWAVGDAGLTLHFDGAQWTAHELDPPVDLISLWGSEAHGVVAVGGRASGQVARWTGDGWEVELLPIDGLNGVWVDAADGPTAVGVAGTIVRLASGAEFEREDSPTSMVLHAVHGVSGGPRWAVGGTLLSPTPWSGVVVRADP
jgi:hypothetical protein